MTCPITGEPLPDPGQTVSRKALIDFRNRTNNIAGLMCDLDRRLAGEATPTRAIPTPAPPGSRPPLNLSILAAIDDHRDTVEAWAFHVMQHVSPAFRFPRPHAWNTIEAVYQQHALGLAQWEYSPAMIDEVEYSLKVLEKYAGHTMPAKILATVEDLPDKHLTIGTAVAAVKLATGKHLPKQTVYSWERRGKIKSSGDPKRYSMRDLLTLVSADTPERPGPAA